jgi:TrmH family RNA methyltransferase
MVMISKLEISETAKLNLKKFRLSENKFIAEGKRLVLEGLQSSFSCEKIIFSEDFYTKETDFLSSLEKYSNKISKISNKDFAKIASTKNPQGIAAVFNIPKEVSTEKKQKTVICLENISDPGNVGTILRTCDWFGVKSVLLSKECAEIYNPKVLRASMGAIFTLKVSKDVDLIEKLLKFKEQDYKLYFADMNGKDYRKIDANEKKVIVFCNEAFGPSAELKKICDSPITIPKKGNIESLNVAAAAAVILARVTD